MSFDLTLHKLPIGSGLRPLIFQILISQKGEELEHVLLLNINRQAFMGNLATP